MESIGEDILDYQQGQGEGTPFHKIIRTTAERNLTIEQRSLKEVIEGSYFVIPEYQRGYQWSEDQFEDLWKDLLDLMTRDYSEENKLNDVFFGSMFFAKTEEYGNDTSKNTLEVIDGQQRLTSTFVLLKLIKDRLNSFESEVDFEDLSYSHRGYISEINGIDRNISLHSGAGTPDESAMRLNDFNREFFGALMVGDEKLVDYIVKQDRVHNNTKHDAIRYKDYSKKLNIKNKVSDRLEDYDHEIEDKVNFNKTNKHLMELYHYFDVRLDEGLEENFQSVEAKVTSLINLKRYLLNNYQVGYFDVAKDSSELLMKIFRVLNDRGMDLKKMDIIKTRIYSFFDEEEDREKWSDVIEEFEANPSVVEDFITDYFFINESGPHTRSKISDSLLQAFEKGSTVSSSVIEPRLSDKTDARDFLQDVSSRASYYHDIIEPFQRGMELDDDNLEEECNRILIRLDNLGTKQWQPLTMAMYYKVKESDVPETKLRDTLDQIEKINLRFVFTNLNPNVMEKVYAKVGEEFRKFGFDSNPEKMLASIIKSETDEMTGSSFVDNLIRSDIQSKKVKQLYRRMATSELLDQERNEEMIVQRLNRNDNIVQIEHIFPQSPRDKDGDYGWIEEFFHVEDGYGLDQTDRLRRILEVLVENDEEEKIEEISESFIQDFANMVLLHGEDNKIASNDAFSKKKNSYDNTNYFDVLSQNNYLRTVDEWNFKEMTERKKELVEQILKTLELEDNEFESVELSSEIEDETTRRIKVLAANNDGVLED